MQNKNTNIHLKIITYTLDFVPRMLYEESI